MTSFLPTHQQPPGFGLGAAQAYARSVLRLCLSLLLTAAAARAASAPAGHEIVNIAQVTYSDLHGTLQGQASATVSTVVTGAPALKLVRLTGTEPARMGGAITYTIEYQNIGSVAAHQVVLTDALSSHVVFASASDNGAWATTRSPGGLVTWQLGTLEPGQSGVRTVTATIRTPADYAPGDPDAIASGTMIVNTATLGAIDVAEVMTATISTPVSATAQLSISQSADVSTTSPGSVIHYTIHYENSGDGPAAGVVITAAIPAGAVYVGGSASGEAVLTGTVLTWQIGALPAGGSGEVTFAVAISENAAPDDRITSSASIQDNLLPPVQSAAVTVVIAASAPGLRGRVYDSVTGKPVANLQVWLLKAGAPLPAAGETPKPEDKAILPEPAAQPGAVTQNPLSTKANGQYEWPIVDAGQYRLWVEAETAGYRYASTNPSPKGSVQRGSRAEIFTINTSRLTIDLPIDPPAGQLTMTKEANKTSATVGDTVEYRLKLSNSQGPVDAVEIQDTLPRGLEYLPGSTRVNGARAEDSAISGRILTWSVGLMQDGDDAEVRYRVVLGPNVDKTTLTNRVFARGRNSAGETRSLEAVHDLDVSLGIFTQNATIIGKVFADTNQNGLQDPGENGLPEVTIRMENGRWAVTDQHGKFHLHAVRPGNHVLRADLSTLGPAAQVKTGGNRFLGSANSQFVDVTLPGTLYQADFPVSGLPPAKSGDLPPAAPAPTPANAVPATAPPAPPAATPLSLEEQIENMTPELAILSPADGGDLSSSHVNVLLKGPLGVKLSLLLNGQEVPEKRIGRTISNPKKQVMIVEYISLDLTSGAENTLEVVMKDNFGNVRGRQTVTVRCPGQPASLVITTEPESVPADGKSLLTVRVAVLDKAGLPVKTGGAMTVSVSDGDIVEKDASRTDDGHQITCPDGQAVFTIRAPRTSVDATVTASFDTVEQKQNIFFPADLSDLVIVGTAELTIGLGSSNSGLRGLSHSSDDWFEDGAYAGGRTAFFAKGKITDTTLLTAAYDTHKPKQDDFFDENLGDVDAEDQYPLYGDESRTGNDAQSRDKLYLRLDRGRSNVLYGDYETDFTDTSLARYTRTFTGLKGNYVGERLRVTGFAAHSDQVQVVDTIPARGISGYYYFSRGQVVDGSERVVVETRDRYRPGRIIRSESKARGTDYEMEYDTGAILFKAPVPSYDSDLNPIYIVVSYESETAAEDNYTYGGRAVYQATDALDLGVTAIVEENDIADESLYGADLTLRLPLQTVLKSEIAWSESLFDKNGRPEDLRQDSAWLIELESRPVDGLLLHPYYKETGEDFRNDSATNSIGGRREAGIDLQYDLDPTTKLRAQHLDERDTVNDAFYRKTSLGLDKQISKTTLGLDLAYENSSDGPINTQTSDTFRFVDRSSFDISEETVEDSLSLTLRTETQLWKNLSLILSHRQELRYEDHNITQAGLRYRLPRNTAIYAKEEWARYTDRTESRLVLGMETDVAKNTTGYSEYRLADGSDGRSVQQGIGLRNTWRLTDSLSGSASAEHLTTTSGAERTNQPDAFALAGSAEYLPNDYLKITSRLEYRDATDETSTLAELGLATKLHRDLSMLNRYRLFRDDFKDDGLRVTSRLLTGFAYRPVAHSRFSALAKFEYKQEEDDTADFATDSDSTIASLEMIYQLTRTVQVAGKYAGKLVQDQDRNYTDLVAARLRWDITNRFDVGVGYRMLQSHDIGAISHGGFAEVGYRVIKNVWMSVGYSFDAFDSDLTGESHDGKGVYLKLRLKFDEKTLDDMAK